MHAVCVFRDSADGRYRLGGNQYFYGALDLDPGNRDCEADLVASAQGFYGDQCSHLLVFSDSSQMTQEFYNMQITETSLAPHSGRGPFNVRS